MFNFIRDITLECNVMVIVKALICTVSELYCIILRDVSNMLSTPLGRINI